MQEMYKIVKKYRQPFPDEMQCVRDYSGSVSAQLVRLVNRLDVSNLCTAGLKKSESNLPS